MEVKIRALVLFYFILFLTNSLDNQMDMIYD